MNRKARRKVHKMRETIALDQIDKQFDLQVDAKIGQIVMVFANAKGRKVVEDLWPDVEWTTDEIFSSIHSPEWLFTHVRVTKLPPHLEKTTPLPFASLDQLGFAVAMALQRVAEPGRVAYYSGHGHHMMLNSFGKVALRDESAARSLFVEYVPAGTMVRTGPDSTDAIQ
jgi:hypothetical protein